MRLLLGLCLAAWPLQAAQKGAAPPAVRTGPAPAAHAPASAKAALPAALPAAAAAPQLHSGPAAGQAEARAETPAATAEQLAALFDSSDPLERLLAWETVNDSVSAIDRFSKIDARYKPALGRRLPVKYLEIPVEDLHVVDHGQADEDERRAIYVERDGRTFFRFGVHPQSEKLYAPLLARYGASAEVGEFTPTSSARSGLGRARRIFEKLGIDAYQSGLGRAIPDWEVRRSVAVSALARSIPADDERRFGVSVIPEIAGAYVDKRLAAGSYVDDAQRTIFQHGMIYRSTKFAERFPELELYPAFALLSGRGAREPLLVEWAREQNLRTGIPLSAFVDDAYFRPILRAVSYLVMHQGLLPDAHTQNMVVAVDPITRRIKHVFFRDVGSFKVNLELRMARGLPVEPLRGPNAAYDFKFEWATEISDRPFYTWFFNWTFDGLGSPTKFASYVDRAEMKKLFDARLRREMARHLPGAPHDAGVPAALAAFIAARAPRLEPKPAAAPAVMAAFLKAQEEHGQTVPLRWEGLADAGPIETEWGVVYRGANGTRLALLPREGVTSAPPPPTHFEAEVAIERLIDVSKLLKRAAEPRDESAAASSKLPQAIRLGPAFAPRYHLLNGVGGVVERLRRGERKVMLDVLHDWSGLPRRDQRRLLERFHQATPPEPR